MKWGQMRKSKRHTRASAHVKLLLKVVNVGKLHANTTNMT